jgi:hypothetical protein
MEYDAWDWEGTWSQPKPKQAFFDVQQRRHGKQNNEVIFDAQGVQIFGPIFDDNGGIRARVSTDAWGDRTFHTDSPGADETMVITFASRDDIVAIPNDGQQNAPNQIIPTSKSPFTVPAAKAGLYDAPKPPPSNLPKSLF